MRHTFSACKDRYLATYCGIYTAAAHGDVGRKLRMLNRHVSELYSKGEISTEDPYYFCPEDIVRICTSVRGSSDLKPSTYAHYVSNLNSLCVYCGNFAVAVAKKRYPLCFPARSTPRRDKLSVSLVNQILAYASSLDVNSSQFRCIAPTVFAIATGGRSVEIANLKVRDIDLESGKVYFSTVKGQGTYGFPRYSVILPECRCLVEKYLAVSSSSVLFSNHLSGLPLSTNSLRRMRQSSESFSGLRWTYRDCRRFYAQHLLDLKVSIDSVSVMLGHSTTKTTEREYARITNDAALIEALDLISIAEDDDKAGYKEMVHPPGIVAGYHFFLNFDRVVA